MNYVLYTFFFLFFPQPVLQATVSNPGLVQASVPQLQTTKVEMTTNHQPLLQVSHRFIYIYIYLFKKFYHALGLGIIQISQINSMGPDSIHDLRRFTIQFD